MDKRIRRRIIEACDLKHDDTVLEIGPGLGALTSLAAPQVRKLICVETDRELIDPLKRAVFAEVIHADFLKWDMGHLPSNIKVIGNIPYNISTPIIEKLIAYRHKISAAFLTVQLEFGQRLVATPSDKKDYGRLSCFVQYYADVTMLFKIKNTCFKPAPRVDSCFVRLIMKSQPDLLARHEGFLFKLIQTAFQQRRKTLLNALKGLADKKKLEEVMQDLGLNLTVRPENLSLADYVCICNRLMV